MENIEKIACQEVTAMINECSATGIPNDHIEPWVKDLMIGCFIAGAEHMEKTLIDKADKWLAKYFVLDHYGMSPSGYNAFFHLFKKGLKE